MTSGTYTKAAQTTACVYTFLWISLGQILYNSKSITTQILRKVVPKHVCF